MLDRGRREAGRRGGQEGRCGCAAAGGPLPAVVRAGRAEAGADLRGRKVGAPPELGLRPHLGKRALPRHPGRDPVQSRKIILLELLD